MRRLAPTSRPARMGQDQPGHFGGDWSSYAFSSGFTNMLTVLRR